MKLPRALRFFAGVGSTDRGPRRRAINRLTLAGTNTAAAHTDILRRSVAPSGQAGNTIPRINSRVADGLLNGVRLALFRTETGDESTVVREKAAPVKPGQHANVLAPIRRALTVGAAVSDQAPGRTVTASMSRGSIIIVDATLAKRVDPSMRLDARAFTIRDCLHISSETVGWRDPVIPA
ncbi:hypothetical protein [Salipiger aestuarii]|uniref:hypothetical protein n=1 Tax=Salipiger aestuarii TaxID=568098 RepID=UPI0016809C88|nr:hypothetical protein [Salipiger aestuarii]